MLAFHLTQRPITLRGSAQVVREFFEYGLSSILYQRGLYPHEDFRTARRYGLNLLVVAQDDVRAYMDRVLAQVDHWLQAGSISKLVLVVSAKDTGEALERWSFDIKLENNVSFDGVEENVSPQYQQPQVQVQQQGGHTVMLGGRQVSMRPLLSGNTTQESNPFTTKNTSDSKVPPQRIKTEREINAEIAAVLRQITASVSFLPILQQECTFNILVYVDKAVAESIEWIESDARLVHNAEQVKLRSFSTSIHKLEGAVSYKTCSDMD